MPRLKSSPSSSRATISRTVAPLWLGHIHCEPEITALTSLSSLERKGLARQRVGAQQCPCHGVLPLTLFTIASLGAEPTSLLSSLGWLSRLCDASIPRSVGVPEDAAAWECSG